MEKVRWVGPFNDERELPVIGDYKGVQIAWEEDMHPSWVPDLVELSKAYIDAYEYLWGTPPRVINASYAMNNLRYLYDEWCKTGTLYRIAVPFTSEDSRNVKEAQFVAGFRSLLHYDGEPENIPFPRPYELRILKGAYCEVEEEDEDEPHY